MKSEGYYVWALNENDNSIFGKHGNAFTETEIGEAIKLADEMVSELDYNVAVVVNIKPVYMKYNERGTQCNNFQATAKRIAKYFQRIFATQGGS